MYIPGHLAVGYLVAAGKARGQRRPPRLASEVAPALLGALTPDIVDKTLIVLDVHQHSRGAGHSALMLLVIILGWALVHRSGIGPTVHIGMWVLGIASHLAADLANDFVGGFLYHDAIFSTWFVWPLTGPDAWQVVPGVSPLARRFLGVTPLELLVFVGAGLVAIRLHCGWKGF